MGSTTRMLYTEKISASIYSSIIVRLMMASNDATLVNVLLEDWCSQSDRQRKWRGSNGRLFLAKLQMAYVFEALEIVREIRTSIQLRDHVGHLRAEAQEAYEQMLRFIDSADYPLLAEFRNSAAFHYDAKRASRAVQDISDAKPGDVQSASKGDEVIDWHYALGDKAYEQIVVRHIFKVPPNEDVKEASDKIANRFFDMSEALIVFSEALIRRLT